MFKRFHEKFIEVSEEIVNPVAFLLSVGPLIYYYAGLGDNLFLKIIYGLAGGYADLLAWRSWGKAHTYAGAAKDPETDRKLARDYKKRAFGLRFCTVIYLILCSGLADVSFFMSAIDKKVDAGKLVTYNITAAQNRINQIDVTLGILNTDLKIEAENADKKGFGGKSQTIIDQQTPLNIERAGLVAGLEKSSKTSQEVFKDPYEAPAKLLKISSEVLKGLSMLVLIFMIQLGLLLTPWNIKIGTTETVTEPPTAPPLVLTQTQAAGLELDPPLNIAELLTYITGMYKTERGEPGPLHGDARISGITGISEKRCLQYKDVLKRARVLDRPLIDVAIGVTSTTFARDVLLDYVRKGVIKL